MTDKDYMDLAIALAEKGRGYTSPNPMVGAVVVKNGTIVGRGWHKGPGLAHAEVVAIDDAGDLALGSDLYVTLEPCNHTGRTPPCTQKILNSKLRRVFVGTEDPNPFVGGGGISFLQKQGVEVKVGICRKSAETLIEDFIWYVKHDKLPFVVVKSASTLDGRLATRTGDSKWITNELSRKRVHELRHWVDAILVGAGTVRADDPSLTARIPGVDTRDPIRVVLDARLTIDPEARVLTQSSNARTIIVTSLKADPERLALLKDRGVDILTLPEQGGMIDLESLMVNLGELGVMSVLIEGGGKVIHSALACGIVNKFFLFMAPKLSGGDDGISICRGKGPDLMKDAVSLSRVEVERFDDDILVTGYLKKS